jgi:TolB-like protein
LADVFISYAREDRDFVDSLASNLVAAGLSVWWDRNISGGAEFAQTIEEELNNSASSIVVWSTHSLNSHWVRDEAEFAREHNKLLPISLNNASPPLGFRQLHALNFESSDIDPTGSTFHELLTALGVSPSVLAATKEGQSTGPGSRATKPGLIVTHFTSRSSDHDLEYIAEDLTEDIVTMLASFGHIRVASKREDSAPVSETQHSAKSGDIRYQVEGSVRKQGERLRVTVQLVETETGENIWARKFDQPLEVFNENPDDVVEKICGSLFSQLVSAEADRADLLAPEELGAWEYCQLAARMIPQAGGSMERMPRLIAELENAIRVQPDYALAHAILSWGTMAAYINGMYNDADEMNDYLRKFDKHLREARTYAKDDLLTLTYIGAAENYSGQQDLSVHTLEKVLARNPASADAWYMICMPYLYLGRYDDARHAIARASELSPEAGYSPQYEWYGGLIEFIAGEFETARPMIDRTILNHPKYGYACAVGAICAYLQGDEYIARGYVAQAKKHNPHLIPRHLEGMLQAQPDEAKGASDYQILLELWGDN